MQFLTNSKYVKFFTKPDFFYFQSSFLWSILTQFEKINPDEILRTKIKDIYFNLV